MDTLEMNWAPYLGRASPLSSLSASRSMVARKIKVSKPLARIRVQTWYVGRP